MNTPITSFQGEYRFLSNFWPAFVYFEGVLYPTVENAYQAAKTTSPALRASFVAIAPGAAKRLARQLDIRSDWHDVNVRVMAKLLAQKFALNTTLAATLLATDDRELIEGNTWGDTFWGVCRGKGQNVLGNLLMQRRNHLARISLET